MTIPVTSSRVNIAGLDPTLAMRVDAFLNDPRMKGYRVVSGVRSYAMQKSLYSGWRKKLAGIPGYSHYNLAANPDAIVGEVWGGITVSGSYHMPASDGYGHAVDLRKPVTHSVTRAWTIVGAIGAEYGLRQTVRGEWWHLQARNRYELFPAPKIATPIPLVGKAQPMLIQYGFFTYLNEGWRYRFLSSADSVQVFKDAGLPVVKITPEVLSTWKALRTEALEAGRLDGEPADVAASY